MAINQKSKSPFYVGIRYNTYSRLHRNDDSKKRWNRQKERFSIYCMNNEVRCWKARQRLIQAKNSIYKYLGGYRCVKCNYNKDIRALQIDHITDTGKKDRQRFRGSNTFYYYYKRHPFEARKNLQILCANCNMIKAHDIKQGNVSRRKRYNLGPSL